MKAFRGRGAIRGKTAAGKKTFLGSQAYRGEGKKTAREGVGEKKPCCKRPVTKSNRACLAANKKHYKRGLLVGLASPKMGLLSKQGNRRSAGKGGFASWGFVYRGKFLGGGNRI